MLKRLSSLPLLDFLSELVECQYLSDFTLFDRFTEGETCPYGTIPCCNRREPF